MKILKSEINYLIQITLTWTVINFAGNLFGLWFMKLLNEAAYIYPENIMNEFFGPILLQSLLFGICISVAFLYMKKKNLAHYAFGAFQFMIFHIILVFNLKIHHGLHFVTTFDNPGLKYLSYCGQYMVDILYLYFPVNGNFENGMFAPENLGTFYIHWIFLNIVYYFAITWVSIQAVNFLFKDSIEKPKIKE